MISASILYCVDGSLGEAWLETGRTSFFLHAVLDGPLLVRTCNHQHPEPIPHSDCPVAREWVIMRATPLEEDGTPRLSDA